MDKMLTLGIILSAKDAFSSQFSTLKNQLGSVGDKLQSFSAKSAVIGTSFAAVGVATQGMSQTVLDSFISLEDARTRLENTLMKSDGSVSGYFKSINDEATKLGNSLPGSTADFYEMASTLKSLGVEEKSIVGGALKSAAYLGVVLKIPYEEAATATAKFKQALGIADAELLPFIDDIQRMSTMGVKVGEMSYAFSKVGATMKGLGMSGLKAARDIEPLVGLLIQNGISGETAGTGLGNIMKDAVSFKGNKQLDGMGIKLNFNDAKGNFKGTANMIKELEKLKAIKSDSARLSAVESIFGKGESSGMVNILIQKGTKGVEEFNHEMKIQADINQRAAKASATLGNLWESLTGTAEGLFGIMGESVAPALKGLTNYLNGATSSMSSFAKEHPILTQGLSWIVVGLTAVTTAAGFTLISMSVLGRAFAMIKLAAVTTAGAFTFLGGVIRTVSLFLLTNPIGLAIAGIATAAFLIYKYWGPIKSFFADLINSIAGWFNNLFTWFDQKMQAVGSTIGKVKNFFGMGGDSAPTSMAKSNPKVAAVRGVPQKAGGSNTVNVNISNPNFASKEHAAQTQKQIDEQVRKALQKQENDKKDRSYS